MSQNSIELAVRRETSLKQSLGHEGLVAPTLGANGAATSASNTERHGKMRKQVLTGHVQFAACCVPLFLAGWNDGTLGPLLPRIQSVYHVSSFLIHPMRA